MKRISEHEFVGRLSPIMLDRTLVPVTMDIADLWLLVSVIQLATRHPHLSAEMKGHITDIAHQMENAVIERHPGAAELFEQGWNPDLDV